MIQFFNIRRLVLLLVGVNILVVVMFVANLLSSLSLYNDTIPVHIATNDESAVLTISQTDTVAARIGVGSVSIRLKPGSYFIMGQVSGQTNSKTIQVKEGEVTDFSLTLSDNNNGVSTPQALTFTGFDELINNGLSSSQVSNIKTLFHSYKKDAQTVAITPSSVQPGARDGVLFNISFDCSIDSTKYSASLKYSGFEYVELNLKDKTGKTVFSNALPVRGD